MDPREFFFRNRSYTPIPLVLVILYFADKEGSIWLPGVFLVVLGEWVRLNGVRHAGRRTRTRKVGAKKLCTSGPFAHVRNPLYLGNMMIYSSMVLIAGGAIPLVMLAATLLFFAMQYSLIISLEEETLAKLFGKDYERYKKAVPRWIPRLRRWIAGANESSPSPWFNTLKIEKRTLQTIAAFLLVLIIRVYLFS